MLYMIGHDRASYIESISIGQLVLIKKNEMCQCDQSHMRFSIQNIAFNLSLCSSRHLNSHPKLRVDMSTQSNIHLYHHHIHIMSVAFANKTLGSANFAQWAAFSLLDKKRAYAITINSLQISGGRVFIANTKWHIHMNDMGLLVKSSVCVFVIFFLWQTVEWLCAQLESGPLNCNWIYRFLYNQCEWSKLGPYIYLYTNIYVCAEGSLFEICWNGINWPVSYT